MKVFRRIGTLGVVAAFAIAPLATSTALSAHAEASTLAAGVPSFSQSAVTLTASKARAQVTSKVSLSIQVRPGTSNRVANLQSSLNGRGGWSSVAKLRTDRIGLALYTITSATPQSLYYRVVVDATSRYSPATSDPVRVVFDKARTTLDVTWPNSDLVQPGDQINGVVTPGVGRNALLERYNFLDDTWDLVDSDMTDSNGKFRVRLDSTGAGTSTYRVRVPATKLAKEGVSDEVDLTFDDGTGHLDGSVTWPSGSIDENSVVFGDVSGLDAGTEYDIILQFVDPESGNWSGDGTDGATVDTEITDYSFTFMGLSGYAGDVRVVLLDNYGQILWASDPQYVDVA